MTDPPVIIDDTSRVQLGAISRLRIIVLGYIIRGPLGGLTWHHLQYLIGLTRLGHDVYFFEDSDNYPSCYHPETHIVDTDPKYGLAFAKRVFHRVGLGDRWAYHDAHTSRWLGPCAKRILQICSSADLLLNLSGMNPLRPWLVEIPERILIDTDPVFTQLRHLTDPEIRKSASQHTGFFSFAENIGQAQCNIPNDHFPWEPTRQPIILDLWPITPGLEERKFTTVMQWDSYPAQEYNGRRYGMKSESFGPYMNLPKQLGPVFELAIGSSSAPYELLESKGWGLRDPIEVSKDPWTYQHYIQGSKAEFSIAKHGYVVSRSGWFSDRSAAYLASGRPVILQETGFSDWLNTGAGIISFNTPDQAIVAIEEINRCYKFHCEKALEIAREYFDSRKVLTDLIERVMN